MRNDVDAEVAAHRPRSPSATCRRSPTEPLGAMNRASAMGHAEAEALGVALRRDRRRSRPARRHGPETMWPPSSSPSFRARSRLMRVPLFQLTERGLRQGFAGGLDGEPVGALLDHRQAAAVAGDRGAHVDGRPGHRSWRSRSGCRPRFAMARTVPMSVMMPVNMLTSQLRGFIDGQQVRSQAFPARATRMAAMPDPDRRPASASTPPAPTRSARIEGGTSSTTPASRKLRATMRAAFDHEAVDAAPPEFAHGTSGDAPAQHLGPAPSQLAMPGGRSRPPAQDEGPGRAVLQVRAGGRSVPDHRPAPCPFRRGWHRTGRAADGLAPHGLRPGDGGALADTCCDLAIGRNGKLQNHLRALPGNPREEARHVAAGLVCHQSRYSTAIPAARRMAMAAAGDAGVGVLDRRDHAGDARPAPAPRRRAASCHDGRRVRASHRRSRRVRASPAMSSASVSAWGLPPGCVQPTPSTRAVPDDHAADIGILRRRAQRPAAQPQRVVHPAGVVSGHRSRRRPRRPRVRPAAPRNPWPRGNSCRPRRSGHRPRRRAS